MTHLTRTALEAAAFWHENVCFACGAIQRNDQPAGAPCQECESPSTTPASVALNFLDMLEDEDE